MFATADYILNCPPNQQEYGHTGIILTPFQTLMCSGKWQHELRNNDITPLFFVPQHTKLLSPPLSKKMVF
jgi:hypothetical protein